MLPQGTSIIDTSALDNLTARLNAIASAEGEICADIQDAINEGAEFIEYQAQYLTDQFNNLAIVKLLLTLPTDLDSLLTWVGNLATYLVSPAYQVYLNTVATLTALSTAATNFIAACNNVKNAATQCSITVPSIVIVIPTP